MPYTCLYDACSSKTPNNIYVIAITYDPSGTLDDFISTLIQVDLNSPAEHKILLRSDQAVPGDYLSSFEFMDISPDGNIIICDGSGFISFNTTNNNYSYRLFDWKHMPPPKVHSATSIYVSKDRNTYFGSSSGTIFYSSENNYKNENICRDAGTGIYRIIDKVHGVGDFLCAVGWKGIVGKKNSKGPWESVISPSNSDFLCVFCKKTNEIYIGDRGRNFWLWDGNDTWTPLNYRYPKNKSLRVSDIIEYQGQMYLACGNDGIYKMDNNKITPIPKFHDEAMVTKFRVTNAGLVGMVAENNESDHWLTHFDGNKWSAHDIFVKLW